jgi:hypothetical protein
MYLNELIEELSKRDPAKVVPRGFDNPHSYRGYYDELAFEPCGETTVGAMLEAAQSAVGATYQGWKGGDFTMGDWTPVHLAYMGDCGEGLGRTLLGYMLGEIDS